MKPLKIYLLAGLGFDYRIFENLVLENCEINYLHWPEPEINESLDNYVKRITKQIKISDEPIILIGHSFGGIIVQEISKVISSQNVIIISSIKSKKEIPITLKFLKTIPLYKFFNQKLILTTFPIWSRAFGYNSEKGRNLFIQMISNCTDNYFRWSMDKIVNWKGNKNWLDVIHIHGSRDKTFPIKKIINPVVIEDGSHFMVYSKGEEVSKVINQLLK
jgi:hypothetical protein